MNKEKFTTQMKEMLAMQDKINNIVNPEWRDARYPWYRAIWIECAELMDHYGWKWWKRQEPDLEQAKLELVDIWHFMLSCMLQGFHGIPPSKKILEVEREADKKFGCDLTNKIDFHQSVEGFVLGLMGSHTPDAGDFFFMCRRAGMTFDELYKLYIGKNVLNFFRQEHGYKEGTYEKVWVGKEDNVWLMEIIAGWHEDEGDFSEYVRKWLADAYIFGTGKLSIFLRGAV